MKNIQSKLFAMDSSASILASELFTMDFQEEIAMAVDTDELIDFIIKATSEVRMLIRKMSIEAASRFGLVSSTLGDLSYLYHRGIIKSDAVPAMAEIIRWAGKLARGDKKIYFVKIGREPEDFEEIRLEQFGTLGIGLKKSVYLRAA